MAAAPEVAVEEAAELASQETPPTVGQRQPKPSLFSTAAPGVCLATAALATNMAVFEAAATVVMVGAVAGAATQEGRVEKIGIFRKVAAAALTSTARASLRFRGRSRPRYRATGTLPSPTETVRWLRRRLNRLTTHSDIFPFF